jgi:membrane protease YdiL (CAAX protease family)
MATDTSTTVVPPDDPFAASLRGFGPIGIAAILVILAGYLLYAPLSAILVLLWAQRSRTPWRAVGYVRPERWLRTVAVGLCFGGAFKLLMKAVVMPLLGADPLNSTYHYLVGNAAALPGTLFTMIVTAGFAEETVFRGYLFERLGKPFGAGAWAKAAIVLFTSALFASAHYPDQGLAGAEQAMITGLTFGTIFAATGQLPLLMVAHAAFDVVAVAIIYLNLEPAVAHLVFR